MLFRPLALNIRPVPCQPYGGRWRFVPYLHTYGRTGIGDLTCCNSSTNMVHHNRTTAETPSWADWICNPRLRKSVYGLGRATTVIGHIALARTRNHYARKTFGELGVQFVLCARWKWDAVAFTDARVHFFFLCPGRS